MKVYVCVWMAKSNSNKIKLNEVDNIDLWLDGMKEDTLKYIAHVGAFGYKGDIHEQRF